MVPRKGTAEQYGTQAASSAEELTSDASSKQRIPEYGMRLRAEQNGCQTEEIRPDAGGVPGKMDEDRVC
jgi:hypothetical protein